MPATPSSRDTGTAWLLATLAALVFLLLPPLAMAQAVPATDVPRVAFPVTSTGNVTTFGPLTADAANARTFSFGVAANGAVFANRPGAMPTPGGASIPVSVSSQIPKATVAAALGRFARKTIPLLATGSALYDLGQELGFVLANPNGGPVTFSQLDPAIVCVAAPCFEYSANPGMQGFPWVRNPVTACQTWTSFYGRPYVGTSGTGQYVNCLYTQFGSTQQFTMGSRSAPAQQPTYVPSTEQAFIDAVNARASWPATSALARATVDAINSGESLQVQPQTVTGPATSPGPVTTITNPAANTTTTNTVTHNYTYNGPNVSVTTTTTSVTVNNSTGAVTNNGTTTTTPEVPAKPEVPQPVCGGPGLPACAVKVDEAGTPAYNAEAFRLDPQIKATQDQQVATASGTADKAGMFSQLASLFTLPPVRECEAVAMPRFMSWDMPSINPCPVVPWVRGLMSLIWAAAGFAFCWGCVREAI